MKKLLILFMFLFFASGCSPSGTPVTTDTGRDLNHTVVRDAGQDLYFDPGVADIGQEDVKKDKTVDLGSDSMDILVKDIPRTDANDVAAGEDVNIAPVCGNGMCEARETAENCPVDCSLCGDGICSDAEKALKDCPRDCEPSCGDGVCSAPQETSANCSTDCPVCGDKHCVDGEDSANCPADCKSTCGNGSCDIFSFETQLTCPKDCHPPCGNGKCDIGENTKKCPKDCAQCGDGRCTTPKEDAANCPVDCAGLCGDGVCQGNEDSNTCAMDCGPCGDSVCGINESAADCPADCAKDCGNGTCGDGETEKNCPADCACLPDCGDKECGTDKCGNTCGLCGANSACGDDLKCHCRFSECEGQCCGANDVCLADGCCTPDCKAKKCGDDGCGGSCGKCEDGRHCSITGQCVCDFVNCKGTCCEDGDKCYLGKCCTPDCENKDCGDDGCGGDCGKCDDFYECKTNKCVWKVFCGNEKCEPGSGEDCNTCAKDCACGDNGVCMADGSCCERQCEGKDCGDDGCGGTCGDCQYNASCDENGLCACDFEACKALCCKEGDVCYSDQCCTPTCSGRECGDDNCGGDCGACENGLICDSHRCQCDNFVWARSFGEEKSQVIFDLTRAPDDTGFFFTGMQKDTTHFENFWLGKIDNNGLVKWQKSFNGSDTYSHDTGSGIVPTADGNMVAVGVYDKKGAGTSGWAIKRKADGSSIWSKTFGGNGFNRFYDVIVNAAGNYVMVGQVFSSSYYYSGWIVELDDTGKSVASKSYAKSGNMDIFRGVTELSAGGYAITGAYSPKGLGNEYANDGGRMWLVKLKPDFGFSWHKTFKGTGTAEGFSVANAPDNGVIIAGFTMSASKNRDAYIVRADDTGNALWSYISGWPGEDSALKVIPTSNNTFLVTGYSSSGLFVMEIDDTGKVLWKRFYKSGTAYTAALFTDGATLAGGRTGTNGLVVKIGKCVRD